MPAPDNTSHRVPRGRSLDISVFDSDYPVTIEGNVVGGNYVDTILQELIEVVVHKFDVSRVGYLQAHAESLVNGRVGHSAEAVLAILESQGGLP
jgi:hypothetical protein